LTFLFTPELTFGTENSLQYAVNPHPRSRRDDVDVKPPAQAQGSFTVKMEAITAMPTLADLFSDDEDKPSDRKNERQETDSLLSRLSSNEEIRPPLPSNPTTQDAPSPSYNPHRIPFPTSSMRDDVDITSPSPNRVSSPTQIIVTPESHRNTRRSLTPSYSDMDSSPIQQFPTQVRKRVSQTDHQGSSSAKRETSGRSGRQSGKELYGRLLIGSGAVRGRDRQTMYGEHKIRKSKARR
jgi:hypothetical protein